MINHFAERSYEGLVKELDAFNEKNVGDAQRLKSKLTRIGTALNELREQLLSSAPLKSEEEIAFFKQWKPAFIARYFFENELFKIRAKLPRNSSRIKAYYEHELKLMDAFDAKHRFMREYYDTQAEEMDALLFLRGATISPLWIEFPDIDQQFSTPGDGLMARFKCNDMLKEVLLAELQALEKPAERRSETQAESELRWTGETVNFVELAYGLWLTGQFNHGQAQLNQIISWLEHHWGIKAGLHRRTFIEIGRRKRLSVTHFIDQMKTAITRRIESNDL